MLTLTGLRKSFFDPSRGEVRAVDGVDLELTDGVTALVGANGAGKTTLLRLVATLLQPDAGRVLVAGHDTRVEPRQVRAKLGYLSTSTRLYPRLTAREVLRYAAGFYDLPEAVVEERIAAVTKMFRIEEFLDGRCDALSTGQGQRVNLARTLLADPDVLVLDEPTTGLDVVAARDVIAAVEAARRPGRLILLCTHIMAEVEAVADRLILMQRGQIAFDGDPAALGSGQALAEAVHGYIGGDAEDRGDAPPTTGAEAEQ